MMILEKFGFQPSAQKIFEKNANAVPFGKNPVDKYRTKCFLTEKERIASHRARIAQNRSQNSEKSKDSLDDYQGEELYREFYKEKEAEVPYPHKSKKVTPQGFIRDEPSLFEKVIKRYEKWHNDRKDLMASSVVSVDNHDKESLLSGGNDYNQSPGKYNQNVS